MPRWLEMTIMFLGVLMNTGFGRDLVEYFFPPKRKVITWVTIPPDGSSPNQFVN